MLPFSRRDAEKLDPGEIKTSADFTGQAGLTPVKQIQFGFTGQALADARRLSQTSIFNIFFYPRTTKLFQLISNSGLNLMGQGFLGLKG